MYLIMYLKKSKKCYLDVHIYYKKRITNCFINPYGKFMPLPSSFLLNSLHCFIFSMLVVIRCLDQLWKRTAAEFAEVMALNVTLPKPHLIPMSLKLVSFPIIFIFCQSTGDCVFLPSEHIPSLCKKTFSRFASNPFNNKQKNKFKFDKQGCFATTLLLPDFNKAIHYFFKLHRIFVLS